MHIKSIFIAVISTISLTGCFTMMTATTPTSSTQQIKTERLTDHIYAIKETHDTHELVLLGKEKTYHLTTGSESIVKLLALQPDKISINHNQPIYLDLKQDTHFRTLLTVIYDDAEPTESELDTLESLHGVKITSQGKDVYRVIISVEGDVYSKVADYAGEQHDLSRTREVRLVSYELKTVSDGHKVYNKIATLPIAMMLDAATAPFQLIYLFSEKTSANRGAKR